MSFEIIIPTSFYYLLTLYSFSNFYFRKYDLEFVYELDWWEKATFNGLTFIATPVNHWSSRSLFDRNKTLWSGWMVNWPNYSFYFAGDTAGR